MEEDVDSQGSVLRASCGNEFGGRRRDLESHIQPTDINIKSAHRTSRLFVNSLDDDLVFNDGAAISSGSRSSADTGPVLAAIKVRLLARGGEDKRC